jgi:hypothetical protein
MVTELFVFFVLDSSGKLAKVPQSLTYIKYPFLGNIFVLQVCKKILQKTVLCHG